MVKRIHLPIKTIFRKEAIAMIRIIARFMLSVVLDG